MKKKTPQEQDLHKFQSNKNYVHGRRQITSRKEISYEKKNCTKLSCLKI